MPRSMFLSLFHDHPVHMMLKRGTCTSGHRPDTCRGYDSRVVGVNRRVTRRAAMMALDVDEPVVSSCGLGRRFWKIGTGGLPRTYRDSTHQGDGHKNLPIIAPIEAFTTGVHLVFRCSRILVRPHRLARAGIARQISRYLALIFLYWAGHVSKMGSRRERARGLTFYRPRRLRHRAIRLRSAILQRPLPLFPPGSHAA